MDDAWNPSSLTARAASLENDEAIRRYEDGIRRAPCLEFYVNLGALWISEGRPEPSLAPLQKAVELGPTCVPAHVNLAGANSMLGNDAAALASYRNAIALEPDNPETLKRYAAFLGQIGRTDEAAEFYLKLLAARPSVEQFLKFGNCLMAAGRTPEAAHVYRQAIALDNRDGHAHFSLANACQELADVSTAQQHFAHAAELQPDKPFWGLRAAMCGPSVFGSAAEVEAYYKRVESALAHAHFALRDAGSYGTGLVQGENRAERNGCVGTDHTRSEPESVDDSPQSKAGDKPPHSIKDFVEAGTFPTIALSYLGHSARRLKERFAAIYEQYFRCTEVDSSVSVQGRTRTLPRPRIGFLVTRRHEGIFARCMAGVLRNLDRERFETVVLASKASVASLQKRLMCDHLRYVSLADSFSSVVRQVREAACDLLYYWEVGSDAMNYFLPFARLAPVQCTSHGSLTTTGVPAIDYFYSSRMIESEGASDHYSERLWQSRTLLMYQARLPPVSPAWPGYFGMPDGRRLYGCLQNPLKLHPDFDRLLAGILAADPLATIVLLADEGGHAATALQARFTRRMPDSADRVLFLPRQKFADYCRLLQVCDVLVDPLHYGAGSSCYDVFSFNLPLVTLPTDFMPGRVCSAFYKKMQINELVAFSAEDYVRKAVQVATDRDYRSHVTERIFQSSDVLFNDMEAVREHERFFDEALADVR